MAYLADKIDKVIGTTSDPETRKALLNVADMDRKGMIPAPGSLASAMDHSRHKFSRESIDNMMEVHKGLYYQFNNLINRTSSAKAKGSDKNVDALLKVLNVCADEFCGIVAALRGELLLGLDESRKRWINER